MAGQIGLEHRANNKLETGGDWTNQISLPLPGRDLVFPALLNRFAHALDVFLSIVFVEIGRFNIGRRRRIWII